ncbi:hypothetical protein GMOD_00003292 [Pyrenophora seminiperda CCB06]|uniref:Uncharacterized protein n=1 Tax=Pyrenophora seminiperda CCB06 TaxID=1302712 RepID=A0A3M7MIK3_9PLEO|nr:hypothetical protein GMOD_00003292 [Pyrenophora seminiperda CCB06]
MNWLLRTEAGNRSCPRENRSCGPIEINLTDDRGQHLYFSNCQHTSSLIRFWKGDKAHTSVIRTIHNWALPSGQAVCTSLRSDTCCPVPHTGVGKTLQPSITERHCLAIVMTGRLHDWASQTATTINIASALRCIMVIA